MEHNNTQPQTALQEKILQKIHAGELTMRPKVYFTLKLVALFAVVFAVLLVSILILNFILFSIRINSHDSLLGFGARGLVFFLQLFPWPLLAIDIALIAVFDRLIRHFRFGYKSPVLYLLLGTAAVTVFAGLLIDRGTDLNDRLLTRADRHELPFVGELFEGARRPMPGSGVCKCVITAIQGNILTVEDSRSGTSTTLTVVLPADDPRATTTSLKVGDTVFIAGDVDDGSIRAFGVHKISSAPVLFH